VAIQDDAEAYQMLGYLYTKEHQLQKAARALEKAVQLDPGHALAHLYLANAYMMLGQRALGEQEYHKALELDPSLREKLP
jgi:Tfp pilus assembly protein PilF